MLHGHSRGLDCLLSDKTEVIACGILRTANPNFNSSIHRAVIKLSYVRLRIEYERVSSGSDHIHRIYHLAHTRSPARSKAENSIFTLGY